MSGLIALVVFAGLSLNLLVQLGIGIQDYGSESERRSLAVFFQGGIQFITVLVTWCLFSYILSPLSGGFFEYFLIFPLIFALRYGLERVFARFFSKMGTIAAESGFFSGISAISSFFPLSNSYISLSFIALILTLRLAASFLDALVLSFSFSAGNLLAFFLMRAIHRRSTLEQVPGFLRGIPLTLISLGLLSLIFASLATLFFGVLFP
jgi:electron transport complex protein RnfA